MEILKNTFTIFNSSSSNNLKINVDDLNERRFIILSGFFTILFFIIYHKTREISQSIMKSNKFEALNSQQKEEYRQKIVSLVHSILVSPLAIKFYIDSRHLSLMDFSRCTSNLSFLILAIGLGYFIYDIVICTFKYKESGFANLCHAILGLSSILIVVLPTKERPAYQGFVALMFLAEISTIFLNLKYFKFVENPTSKVHEQLSLWFAISFLLVRCLFIAPIIIIYQYFILFVDNYSFSIFMLLEGFLNYGLNFYWGYLIIKKLYKFITVKI